jgi:hypothetical protein
LRARVLFAFLGLACSEAQRPPELAPQPAASSGRSDPSTRAVANASSDGSAPLALEPEPPATVASEPGATPRDRTAATGSTRGTIACGEQRCAAQKEVCVFGAEATDGGARRDRFTCVASGSPLLDPDSMDPLSDTYACDDGTDCPRGKTCCGLHSSTQETYECVPRAEVATKCALEACEEGGAACPPGLTCRHQVCLSEIRATCGPQRGRCPREQPFCSYSAQESKCLTEREVETMLLRPSSTRPDEPGGFYQCARASDCGGGQKCCAQQAGRWTYCAPSCDPGNGMRVCTSVADCSELRTLCGNGPDCLAAIQCKTLNVSPPWIKMCTTVD